MSTVDPRQPQILHGQEVPHLLLGDRDNLGTPALDHFPALLVLLVDAQRVRGVEILHHQAVLDGGAKRQQHQQVVAPRHVGPLGMGGGPFVAQVLSVSLSSGDFRGVFGTPSGRIGLRAKAHRAPPNRPVLLSWRSDGRAAV